MNAKPGYTDDIVAALALALWKGKSHSGPARFLASERAIRVDRI